MSSNVSVTRDTWDVLSKDLWIVFHNTYLPRSETANVRETPSSWMQRSSSRPSQDTSATARPAQTLTNRIGSACSILLSQASICKLWRRSILAPVIHHYAVKNNSCTRSKFLSNRVTVLCFSFSPIFSAAALLCNFVFSFLLARCSLALLVSKLSTCTHF